MIDAKSWNLKWGARPSSVAWWPRRQPAASRRMLLPASPEGCRRLAGDNIPGDRASIVLRPGGALEHSLLNLRPRPLFLAQKSASICVNLRMQPLHKNINNLIENALTFNARQMPSDPAFWVQFACHSISQLKPYGPITCAISTDESVLPCKTKTSCISHCPSIACKMMQAKSHVKNLAIFSGYFDGKSLENQAKTAKNTPKKQVTIMQLLTCLGRSQIGKKSQSIEARNPFDQGSTESRPTS
jgi:hypothetical protein